MKTRIEEHYRGIRRILLVVLILNWTVAIAKLLYGLFSRCESMTADGFHSLSDGTSNIIGLIGIHFACQPKDSEHPYGHKKYETFFSLGIAALLFILAFNLAKTAIVNYRNPDIARVDTRSFIVMIITMGINFWVMNYERKRGLALHSDILVSDALHTKADIFTSLAVIISLVAIKLGYPAIDHIATVVISLFIAHAGYDIIKHSSKILCDTAAILDVSRIRDLVLGIKGVKTCHNIRSRGRPDDIHIDLHIEVDPDMHVDVAHKISYAIEKTIKESMPEITDVIVHIEPRSKH